MGSWMMEWRSGDSFRTRYSRTNLEKKTLQRPKLLTTLPTAQILKDTPLSANENLKAKRPYADHIRILSKPLSCVFHVSIPIPYAQVCHSVWQVKRELILYLVVLAEPRITKSGQQRSECNWGTTCSRYSYATRIINFLRRKIITTNFCVPVCGYLG